MRDALLVVDVINTFEHEDGDRLLASFRERLPGFRAALEGARERGVPVIYANDTWGRWDADGPRLVRDALAAAGGDAIREVAPRDGDRFVLKARYSAFDHTPLVIGLRELEIERLLLAGSATERCLVQTAIDARELGFKVTILTDACATVDEELERLAFRYAEEVVGVYLARVSAWTSSTSAPTNGTASRSATDGVPRTSGSGTA
jgi:nicotinamidase-related amidase